MPWTELAIFACNVIEGLALGLIVFVFGMMIRRMNEERPRSSVDQSPLDRPPLNEADLTDRTD